jgi:hypothetical protein
MDTEYLHSGLKLLREYPLSYGWHTATPIATSEVYKRNIEVTIPAISRLEQQKKFMAAQVSQNGVSRIAGIRLQKRSLLARRHFFAASSVAQS